MLRIKMPCGVDANSNGKCDTKCESTCINEDSKITIAGADLERQQDRRALPNETITINGQWLRHRHGDLHPVQPTSPWTTSRSWSIEDSKGCTSGRLQRLDRR